MANRTIKLAMGQMLVEGGEVRENLQRAAEMIREAAAEGCQDHIATPYGDLWKGAYSALAPPNQMPVVGVSNVGPISGGPWQGRKCIGCSLAVGWDGQVLAQAPYGETAQALVVVPLELTPRRCTAAAVANALES